jgi:ABC-type dipeptide/oligopeptide/nickel transport system ATPase component
VACANESVLRRPRLLVADEPTTALDRTTALEVLSLLDELRKQLGMALLLISHDLGAVRRTCDRIAVIYAGQICEMAETNALLSAPHHRYTRAVLRRHKNVAANVHQFTARPASHGAIVHYSTLHHRLQLHDNCGSTGIKEALRQC